MWRTAKKKSYYCIEKRDWIKDVLPFSVNLDPLNLFFNRLLELGSLRKIDLSGVKTANENNKDAQPKGVKAFFNMDDSGIFNLEKVINSAAIKHVFDFKIVN